MEFVRYAQAGEVDKMLEITSSFSFAKHSDSVRTLYAQEVVPRFEGTVVTWDKHSTGVTDDRYNGGLMFTGRSHGEETISFDIIVMKEDGKLVVINIKRHHWYSRWK
jgi:hypothetical protein